MLAATGNFFKNVDGERVKKAFQRLGLLRKLSFNRPIEKDILVVVYTSLIESVLTCNIVSWFINVASKITGERQVPLWKASVIVGDSSHPSIVHIPSKGQV